MGISYAPKILLDEVEDAGDQKRRGVLRVQRQGGGSRKVSRKVGTGGWGWAAVVLEGWAGFTPV